MRIFTCIALCSLVLAALTACTHSTVEENSPQKPENTQAALPQAGICLTFDDRNLDEWEAMLDVFDRYNAHVTFFFCGPVGEAEAARLKEFIRRGHTVGAHGLKHDSYGKCRKAGMTTEEYAKYDSLGQLESFKQHGIEIHSFACPMSDRNAELDEVLKPYYRHIRTGIFPREDQRLCDMDNAFVPIAEITSHFYLNGKGIDKYPQNTQEMIDDAMTRAAERNELLVFYAHHITEKPINDNHIEPAEVERVLKKGTELGLRFYGFDELP